MVPFTEVSHLFSDFKHTAWRLQTRPGYASDRNSPKWQRWQAGEDIAAEAKWTGDLTREFRLGALFANHAILHTGRLTIE